MTGKRRRRHRSSSGPRATTLSAPASTERRRRRLVLAAVAATALLITACAALTWFVVLPAPSPPAGPRAAIIDELDVTDPNPEFVRRATDLLERGNFSVDYYPQEKVTVNLYRDLAKRGYQYIVIRSHSYGQRVSSHSSLQLGFVGLFTSELYDPAKHVAEQRARELDVAFFPAKQERYFGVNQEFVKAVMRGRMDGATVILMGCDGLSSDGLARAFVARGAASFVSWDREVSAAHTDAATQRLLEHLLVDRLNSQDAVSKTMSEVGPDPTFQSSLLAYP